MSTAEPNPQEPRDANNQPGLRAEFSRTERMQILLLELNLLQTRLDKVDDLVFRRRGWMVTLVMGALGATVALKDRHFALLAIPIPIAFYLLEAIARWYNWHRYVVRYRAVRDTLNGPEPLANLTLYDLSGQYAETRRAEAQPSSEDPQRIREKQRRKLWDCAFSHERFLIYFVFLVAAIGMYFLGPEPPQPKPEPALPAGASMGSSTTNTPVSGINPTNPTNPPSATGLPADAPTNASPPNPPVDRQEGAA